MAAADGGPTEAQKHILAYLKKHSIEQNLNDIVSKCCKIRKDDPWGFMIGEFKKLQTITITDIKARQIFDSRGNPTVEADVYTTGGMFRASVPSGTTKSDYEALELRDGGNNYHGLGVSQAISNIIDIIRPELVGLEMKDVDDQKKIDDIMVEKLSSAKQEEKTEWGWKKEKLGANAVLAVSMAVCKAGADMLNTPLYRHIAKIAGNAELGIPVPAFSLIEGGKLCGNKLPLESFQILPTGAKSFQEAMKMGTEVYHQLEIEIRKERDAVISVGPGGGFAASVKTSQLALDLIQTTLAEVTKQHPEYEDKIVIAIDAAANDFCDTEEKGSYDLNFKNKNSPQKKSSTELLSLYKSFISKSNVVSIEDPFGLDDLSLKSWQEITKDYDCQVIGDSFLGSNPVRVEQAIKEESCNALALNMNQVGTVTESIDAVKLAKNAGWGVTCSYRSGDTTDTFISHLAVGLCTGQISAGAPCRSERVCKYNELLRIEEELGSEAAYAGSKYRAPAHPY